MDGLRKSIEEAGASLTFIGQATPRHAANFRRKQELETTVLADADRVSYKAAGTKIATADELVGPKQVVRGISNVFTTGQIQGRPIGNVAQLGGVLMVAPDGKVVWTHLSDDASDNAPPEDVLAAVRAHSKA